MAAYDQFLEQLPGLGSYSSFGDLGTFMANQRMPEGGWQQPSLENLVSMYNNMDTEGLSKVDPKLIDKLAYGSRYWTGGEFLPGAATADTLRGGMSQWEQDNKASGLDSVLSKVMPLAGKAAAVYMGAQALGPLMGGAGTAGTGAGMSAADAAALGIPENVAGLELGGDWGVGSLVNGPIGGMNAFPGTAEQQLAETAAREGAIDSNMFSNYDGPIGGYNADPGTAAQQASETLAREAAVDAGLGSAVPSILDTLTSKAALTKLGPALAAALAAATNTPETPLTNVPTAKLSGAGTLGSTGAGGSTGGSGSATAQQLAALLGTPAIAQIAAPVITKDTSNSAIPQAIPVSNIDTFNQAGSTWNQALAAQLRGK